jgi:hypothetical protein
MAAPRRPLRAARLLAAALAAFALPAAASDADTMRCGTRLVTLGDTQYEVRSLCGAPDGEAFLGTRSRQVAVPFGPFPGHLAETREVAVEEWIYDPGYGRFLRILTFVGGRLDSIELGPRQ